VTSNASEPILFSRTKVQNPNQIRHSKGLPRATPNHVQNPRLLVPVDAKIGEDNISTEYSGAYAPHMEI
ncbi:hypothetical protein HN011_012082, partial [Eciton burchellii]